MSQPSSDAVIAQLRELFRRLPNKVPVHLFLDRKASPETARLADDFVHAVQAITDVIAFHIHDQLDAEAQRLGVTRVPTLVLAPHRCHVHYLGLPLGEESRTFIEACLLAGAGKDGLSDQSRAILQRITQPQHIRVFVSITCPYCPQQALHAIRAALAVPDRIRTEIIDIQWNQDLAERYGAFSVPQTYANDTLIGQGAQSEEIFCASLEAGAPQNFFIPDNTSEEVRLDLVVVGGGPAGLTAGIYAARSGLAAAVVERGALGGQVATTPVVENYPGISQVPGKTLVDIMVAHALEYVPIFPHEEVLAIELADPITVRTSRRRFFTRAVLLATGARYRRLDVPGEARLAGRGVSYCSTCDGPMFRGKRALVVGGGNSAVTEALHLRHIGVDISLVHRRDQLRAQEHLVRALQHEAIPVLWNSTLVEIRGERRVESAVLRDTTTGALQEISTDAVFIAVGYDPEITLANALGLTLTPEGFIAHDGRHRTSAPGVYVAGDVAGGFRQIVTATGAGAAAALTIAEDLTTGKTSSI
jgi:thioredoxin reductase (NADPH)